MKSEKRIEFYPAYDRQHLDPSQDYGIHGVDLAFYFIGDKGAVQFKLSTGWLLPYTVGIKTDRLDWKHGMNYPALLAAKTSHLYYPSPTDLGYHSKESRYEDQPKLDCHLLEQGFCYYDGSSLNAYEPFDILLHKGSEGVFEYLEEYYKELFEGKML